MNIGSQPWKLFCPRHPCLLPHHLLRQRLSERGHGRPSRVLDDPCCPSNCKPALGCFLALNTVCRAPMFSSVLRQENFPFPPIRLSGLTGWRRSPLSVLLVSSVALPPTANPTGAARHGPGEPIAASMVSITDTIWAPLTI